MCAKPPWGPPTGLRVKCKLYLFSFFFLRKISPELTATNPPLFADEDWPWAKIHAHPSLLYMWDAYHSMACQVVPCWHPGSEPANPGPLRSWTCKLNHCATGPASQAVFLLSSFHLYDLSQQFILWPVEGYLVCFHFLVIWMELLYTFMCKFCVNISLGVNRSEIAVSCGKCTLCHMVCWTL